MTSHSNLGKALDRAIKAKGLTNAEFARVLDIKPQQAHIWRNKKSWNTNTLLRVCAALDMSVDEFIRLSR